MVAFEEIGNNDRFRLVHGRKERANDNAALTVFDTDGGFVVRGVVGDLRIRGHGLGGDLVHQCTVKDALVEDFAEVVACAEIEAGGEGERLVGFDGRKFFTKSGGDPQSGNGGDGL